MSCMCNKCSKCCGWLVLIVGILYLIKDIWGLGFWNLEWYTVAFIIAGFAMIASGCCSKCGMPDAKDTKNKKK